MCTPGCLHHIAEAYAAAAPRKSASRSAKPAASKPKVADSCRFSFSRAVDLTHTISTDFPTFSGNDQLSMQKLHILERDGYNVSVWTIHEHTGTHLDAPFHFNSEGDTADQIGVDRLVVPLAVIDISERAQDNPDARVTPDDIAAYEAQHGPLPDGACVAMFSGWERHLGMPKYRNAGDGGVMRFPGFHIEAAAMLLERDICGIAVDSLSLDYGASPDFAVHHAWLGGGRWGIESVANLSTLPPVGATLVVGAPKIEGASGGPSRVIALV